MGSATAAAVCCDARGVDVLAVFEHPVEELQPAGCLEDVCTGGVVVADLVCGLSVAVEVEIDADGSHACECGESLLLVVTVARGPVAVGADDKGGPTPDPSL